MFNIKHIEENLLIGLD